MPDFGARLKRLRRAQLAGVDQTTVSRWENGTVRPATSLAEAVLRALQAPVHANDAALRRLVESSTLTVHLISDVDHLLLTASPARVREGNVSLAALRGQCLWPAASPVIHAAESDLAAHG